ncbi:serine hydrolase [Desulfoferula mesophila]|uniref:Serine hydrolase n=1 Tax=Desulfoferula mesophila TaxID=3058419 RepID=A0AAU9EW44_9BACT|nr:serine hydrolase [Desulfoferula mesophilus]
MRRRSRLVAAALSWLLLLCLLGLPPAGAAPASQADLQKFLSRFEAYAEKNRRAFGVPGLSMAVVAGDKLVLLKGLGVTALGGGRPVDGDTIFQIGSTSKAFTAAMVAIAADEKKLAWDDRVIEHLPGFLMQDPWVTREFLVKDLMAQHTGLAPHAGELQALFGFGPAHMVASLAHLSPVTSFRSAFAYQNIPFLAAARMVSRLSGLDYAQFLERKIWQPLGMSRTSLPRSGLAQGDNVTRLHRREKGKTVLLPRDWPYQDWIYLFGPAGGINSTARDMAQWLRLNINRGEVEGKRLISAANVEFMHTPATPVKVDLADGALAQYCQAWVYERHGASPTMVWHNGDTSVNHAMIAVLPEAKAGLVMLSNLGGVDMLDNLARYFRDLWGGLEPPDYCAEYLAKLKEADGKSELPPRPKSPLPPQPLERYVGRYANPVYETANVALKGAGLEMTLGPRRVRMELVPWDRDRFLARDPADPEMLNFLVSFEIGGKGLVERFRASGLENEGGGLFRRLP